MKINKEFMKIMRHSRRVLRSGRSAGKNTAIHLNKQVYRREHESAWTVFWSMLAVVIWCILAVIIGGK